MARDSMDSPNYAAIRVRNNEEFVDLMTGLKEYSQNFINENSGSLISLLALYGQVGPQVMVFHPIKDLDVYEKTDSTLFSIYPSLPLVLSLHEHVAVIKAQLAAKQQPSPGTFTPGTQVPDISLASPDGKIIKLSSLRGKIVLLDFWAAWCQPCRQENPTLVENYKLFHSKGFEIYQVSLDRTREDWLNGIKQDQLNWTHVSDLKYWESSVVSQFNIQGIPMNYLLDKEGKVIASNLRGPELGEKLQELFNK
jgi:peroxiredoxin